MWVFVLFFAFYFHFTQFMSWQVIFVFFFFFFFFLIIIIIIIIKSRSHLLSLIEWSINYYYITTLRVFHTSVSWWSPTGNLSDSKFPQISRTLHSILYDLNNSIVWIVSSCPLISKSSSLIIKHLMTVLNALSIIGIIVAFIFHSSFQLSNNA